MITFRGPPCFKFCTMSITYVCGTVHTIATCRSWEWEDEKGGALFSFLFLFLLANRRNVMSMKLLPSGMLQIAIGDTV